MESVNCVLYLDGERYRLVPVLESDEGEFAEFCDAWGAFRTPKPPAQTVAPAGIALPVQVPQHMAEVCRDPLFQRFIERLHPSFAAKYTDSLIMAMEFIQERVVLPGDGNAARRWSDLLRRFADGQR